MTLALGAFLSFRKKIMQGVTKSLSTVLGVAAKMREAISQKAPESRGSVYKLQGPRGGSLRPKVIMPAVVLDILKLYGKVH